MRRLIKDDTIGKVNQIHFEWSLNSSHGAAILENDTGINVTAEVYLLCKLGVKLIRCSSFLQAINALSEKKKSHTKTKFLS